MKRTQVINEALVRRWGDLYDAPVDAEPEMQVISKRFEDAIRRLGIIFRPTEEDGEREYDVLSDGQKSLFYFSLVAAVFDIERRLLDASSSSSAAERYASLGFRPDLLQIPALTLFALEEPENHLASYFLARIIKQIDSVAQSQMAQAVFTSHSPAILGRVPPQQVRHFRLDPDARMAIVREISLPDQPDEVAKYVREAVTAFPEVYFARFVILCEGASEQIVIPRLASALKDLDIDSAFVAVVPLGGRHVNHFWKLLTDLDIPYATLIDLDLGREGGAWGRIKYACEQLLAVGEDRDQLLTVNDGDGNESVLSKDEFAQLHTWNADDIETITSWTDSLEDFGVFLSTPLDLDMAMLSCFPRAYQAIAPAGYGPRIPEIDDPAYQDYLEGAAKTVLGEAGPSLSAYSDSLRNLQQLFPWYRYLFSNKSKPSTHILALSQIDDDQLASSAPPALVRLLNHVSKCLGWEPQTDF
jgi:putative ATP-dependent endonuclease of OLD family